jgi:hypothetical protein
MGNPTKLKSDVERAVVEVLNSMLPGLCEQIVGRVLETVSHELVPVATGESTVLNDVLAAVQAGTTQVQILDAMIDGAARFAARSALFVVRGANAVGWRARGFTDDEAVRNSPVELAVGLPAQAINNHSLAVGPTSEFTADFAQRFGASVEPALVFPLIVRDKVVAIVYADGGTTEHRLDRPGLEALVRVTGLWLEVFATRKMSGPTPTTERPAPVAMAAAAAASTPTIAAPTTGAGENQADSVGASEPVSIPLPSGAADELHKKARRFAKLLVDEIKLYNQAKVSEGRQHRDLYDRLKDDIEKSRASYEKRYGGTSANDGDYFNQELVRILADNDASLLGGNFHH